jgi:hypothetical protein
MLITAVTTLALSLCAHGDTLSSVTGGAYPLNYSFYLGQTFSVFGAGQFSNITFNFYDQFGNPYAIGEGYLLSTAYAGTPAALSAATAGYLGSAAAADGVYSFASQVTLSAGNTYYLYEDSLISAGSITGGPTSSGIIYEASTADTIFFAGDATANYLVAGTLTSVVSTQTPEPSSLLLFGTGLLGPVSLLGRKLLAARTQGVSD